ATIGGKGVAKAPMASEIPAMATARASRFLENLIPALFGRLLGSIDGGVPAEMTEVYPPLAAKLTDLAARVGANDRVSQKLPHGKKWLANTELVARQPKSFFDGTGDVRASPSTCACRRSGTSRSSPTLGRRPDNSCPAGC